MKRKYEALRLIAGINVFFGWVAFISGILGGLYYLTFENKPEGIGILAILIFAFFGGLMLIGSGQLIYLLIDIEENTRRNRQLTEPEIADSIKDESIESVIPQSYSKDKLASLCELINKEKKKLVSGENERILAYINELSADKNLLIWANSEYKKLFGKELIEHLISISSNYSTTYYYVSPLVENGICEEKFPHNIIK